MSEQFFNSMATRNIKPVEIDIKLKQKLLDDILYIEHSLTGRIDSNIANSFIVESAQLLMNSLLLFEKGYFDCAYYSLRQALELSTTMIYLSDMPETEKRKKITEWKEECYFPMQKRMLTELEQNGHLFSDIRRIMSEYFDELSDFNKRINKFVHKQGFKFFYVSRNRITSHRSSEVFSKNFILHLKKCIGYVAVMRLAIDAFPVLFLDEEMYHRCPFEPITGSYSADFVKEYIGNEVLTKYKTSQVFLEIYTLILQEEKRSSCTTQTVMEQYIDTSKIDIIKRESHLLTPRGNIAVQLVDSCYKITKVYICGGMLFYYTDRKSNRKSSNYSSKVFDDFEKSTTKYNIPYDEVFISTIQHENDYYFIEHNEVLLESEFIKLSDTLK